MVVWCFWLGALRPPDFERRCRLGDGRPLLKRLRRGFWVVAVILSLVSPRVSRVCACSRGLGKSEIFEEGLSCQGYEIHMGRSTFNTSYPTLFSNKEYDNPMNLGITNNSGTVIGTYLHGFLDNDTFRQSLLSYVREKKNITPPTQSFDYCQFKQNELDRLEKLLSESVNMKKLSEIIKLKP